VQRPQREAVPRGDQVHRAAHEQGPHHPPGLQQLDQLARVEPGQPRPQSDVGLLRLLRLQADEVRDRVEGRHRSALEEQLTREQRPIQRA
jgi:hypothetical protein